MSKSCLVVFQNMLDLDMPFVRYVTEVEYVRCKREIERTDISSDNDLADLSCCCLPHLFSSFNSIRETDTWGRDVDFKM